jgi:hypothetical protein
MRTSPFRHGPLALVQCPANSNRTLGDSNSECTCTLPGQGWGWNSTTNKIGCVNCLLNATAVDNR